MGLYFEQQHYDYDKYLYDIAKTGASHVGLVISWYQKNVLATDIGRHKTKTVSDARLIRTIHQARRRGLQVFLLPIVRLKQRGPEDWRGVIKPKDMDKWWKSYRAYILHYARLSRQHGVELFSVGSELVSMEHHRQRWLSLVRAIRLLFPGPLIYSANWDHYKPVTFWDTLDYIGISNYYELSKKVNPPVKTLRKAWIKIKKDIVKWKKKYPRIPLVFTEVGYYSQQGTNTYPWDYTREKPLSLEEQRRCYQAFTEAWDKSPNLQGVFFWNWFGKGGPKDTGYTPRGKPAECVMRNWFGNIKKRELKRSFPKWLRTKKVGQPVSPTTKKAKKQETNKSKPQKAQPKAFDKRSAQQPKKGMQSEKGNNRSKRTTSLPAKRAVPPKKPSSRTQSKTQNRRTAPPKPRSQK